MISELQSSSSEDAESQAIHSIREMIDLCKYSCVVVEIERSLGKFVWKMQQKLMINKFHAFMLLKQSSNRQLMSTVRSLVEDKLSDFCKLIRHKQTNYKMTGLYSIVRLGRERKKIIKYATSEIHEEDKDIQVMAKKKEIQQLRRKYNRLIAELSLMHQQVKSLQRRSTS